MQYVQPPLDEYAAKPIEPCAITIVLAGEWDLSRGDELRRQIQPARNHPRVVFDLTNATYVDSQCIGMLMRNRTMRMAKGYPPARLVIANAGLTRILAIATANAPWPVFQTVDEALSDWKQLGNISAVDMT